MAYNRNLSIRGDIICNTVSVRLNTEIPNLNAQYLQGKDSTQFQANNGILTSISGVSPAQSGFLKLNNGVAALDTSTASTSSKLDQFAATSSAELSSVITDETGSGRLVFNNAATLINPIISGNITTANTDIEIFHTANNITLGASANVISVGSNEGSTTINNNLVVGGSLTVHGSSTVVDATTISLKDPIISLGGDSIPVSNDAKDRGIEFFWHDGLSGKRGFFGLDNSTGYLTFIPNANNTSEVFTGTAGDIVASNFRGNLIGSASSADKLNVGKSITITGDISFVSPLFDGSSNVAASATLSNSGVISGTYGSSSIVPVYTVDAKGRITSASNTSIISSSTSVAGIVQLNNTVTSTSTSLAATANSVKTAYDLAATKLNSSGGTISGDLTVSGNFVVNGTTTTINATTVSVADINIELGKTVSPTDATAANGGITLKGTTDKTITWSSTNGWTSSESLNLSTGKTYKINGTDVLSNTTLGSGVISSSLTSVGTITSGTWSGSFGAVSGANLTSLTAGNLSGTIPSAVLGNSTHYVGTTAVTLNRASANLGLTGISSIALPGSTSGTVTLQPTATAGTTTITLPATTGTVITTGDSGTVTSTMIADGTIVNADISASAAIATSKISGLAASATTDTTNANNITSGTISTARLGTGTANSSTYLAGNNTWQTVTGGATITDDTATNSTFYPVFSSATSGTATAIKTSSTKLFYNPSTGTLSATSFNSLSDENFKENIQTITNGLEIVSQINPVSFDWKETHIGSYGVIAQEIEQLLPNIVKDNDGIKSVEYAAIIPFLVSAIKELKAEIEVLKSK